MKILNIVGARPQIIKAAALSRAIRQNYSSQIEEIIIHTGQHYDYNMSDIFFKEMEIPSPHENLGIAETTHGKMTAKMIEKLEEKILFYKPNVIIVYGDTNSTLAASIAAVKYYFHVAHIEAGLRSYNKKMPEEINRIVADHCSTFLFAPTQTAINNLSKEGFNIYSKPPYSPDNPLIVLSGDIMYDNFIYYSQKAESISTFLKKYNLKKSEYILVTIHRNTNTDDYVRFENILKKLHLLTKKTNFKIVFPMHPRTRKILNNNNSLKIYLKNITITDPLSFFDMLQAENNAVLILTDSGGVQKEAYFAKKPCIIMRTETEWKEIVETGNAMLEPPDENEFLNAVSNILSKNSKYFPELFGKGNAANIICQCLLYYYNQ